MENKTKNQLQYDSNSPQIAYQPSKALLENWSLWMAYEVVEQWLTASQVSFEQPDIINLIPKETGKVYLEKLYLKIQQLKNLSDCVKDLENAETEIKQYLYNELIIQIQGTLQASRVKSIESICQLISKNRQQASLETLTAFFRDLCKFLNDRRKDFEEKKIDNLRRENSAWQAYLKLSHQLKVNQFISVDKIDKSTEEAVWRAICMCFESLLNAEYYAAQSQIILSLLHSCQTYCDSVNRSTEILHRIQESLKKKSTLEVISLPVFTYLKKIDAAHQKRLIEIWIGHSIDHWGNSPVSWQQIEAKLLKNLEPVALNTCRDFQHCFLEHLYQSPE